MKRVVVVICAVLTASVGVSIAAAAVSSSGAWTESKAERVVMRDATVRLAPFVQSSLEKELLAEVRLYGALELAALDEGNSEAAVTYHRIAYKFGRALKKVRSGLGIAEAECNGSGPVAQGGHFTRFRCAVTSEELRIPSVQFAYAEDGTLREVIEGEQRSLSAFQARLDVRVTGKSSIAYRQMGAQAAVAPQRDDRPGGFLPS